MDLKQLINIASQIAKERGITPERVLEVIGDAIAAAYCREYGERGEVIRAKINEKTGEVKFWQVKEVVDDSVVRLESGEGEEEVAPLEDGEVRLPRYNPDKHILLPEAREVKPDAAVGDEVEFPLKAELDFGRIAAQAAKQVILQKFREAEKESVIGEFKGKEGSIVSGIVHRFDRGNVYVDLGRVVGVMFANESIPGEHCRANERMRFYVVAVQEDRRGQPEIVLSRSHPRFISKLFELEVPEVADGTVVIKGVAREPGSRTKVAVASTVPGVDPVGSCVGQRGTRVMAVTNEIGQEKIDIIEWSEDAEKFIASSLSPAKVRFVELGGGRSARVIVTEDQLSLAIGKGGQNVRLAAKLTGTRIDVRSEARPEEVQEGGIAAEVSEEGGAGKTEEAAGEGAEE